MFSLLLRRTPVDEDQLLAELMEAGTAGITEEPDGLRAFFDDGVEDGPLLEQLARYHPEVRREP
ncbi:MAG: hypothetical protein M3Z32_03140, partial [Acidobacteriota bacterium]|nr:hypothetical protein [Acidobacteriota bacterium]